MENVIVIKIPQNKILLGDAIKTIKTFPNNSVDVVFADPPFNLNKKYKNARDDLTDNEYLDWCYQWLDECIRVLKPTGTMFIHNIPKWLIPFGSHLNMQGMKFRHWISWDAMGVPLGKTLLPSHYGILYYTKSDNFKFFDARMKHKRCVVCREVNKDYGGKKYLLHPFGNMLSDVWTDIHRIKHNKNRDEHPCQLPEALLERLLIISTEKNDLVLDPFIGAGTTALAAKALGRRYIGIDNSKMYVDITKEKLKKIRKNKNLDCKYVYGKVGQTKTSIVKNNDMCIPHTVKDKDIVLEDSKLSKSIKPSQYFKYDLKFT